MGTFAAWVINAFESAQGKVNYLSMQMPGVGYRTSLNERSVCSSCKLKRKSCIVDIVMHQS